VSVIDEQFEHEEAFPRLTRELLAVIEAAGEERTLAEGEVLNRAGEIAREFYVVLRGSLAGYTDYGSETERLISVIRRGRFWGGTNLLTGQPAYVTTVAPEDGEVIVLNIDELRRVIATNQQIGDLILGAFVARRALLIGRAPQRSDGEHVALPLGPSRGAPADRHPPRRPDPRAAGSHDRRPGPAGSTRADCSSSSAPTPARSGWARRWPSTMTDSS
jgi:CRP-like cAMP-binding protein